MKKYIISAFFTIVLIISLFLLPKSLIALTEGTNCGFVTVTPVADPAGTAEVVGGYSSAAKFTAPVGNYEIIEAGWYKNDTAGATGADWIVGLYDHDAVNDRPNNIVATLATGTSTASTAQWETGATAPAVGLTSGATYWLVVSSSNVASDDYTDLGSIVGLRTDWQVGGEALPDPWGAPGNETDDQSMAIYAKYQATAGAGYVRERETMRGVMKGVFR